MNRSRRPTSADVAREAGLSRATVGYVLNDVPHQTIPEQTRRRVIEAAERLGYRPSAAARSLRTGRSDLVLGLLPDWPMGPAVSGLLTELSSGLEARGLTFVTHQRPAHGRPLRELWKAITPAAVLVLDELDAGDAEELRAAGLLVSHPLRAVGTSRREGGSDVRCGWVQVEHLATTGRRRIGYALPADPRVDVFSRPRLLGARQGCADLGLAQPLVCTVGLDADQAAGAVTAWREAGVDGVCAYNDEQAIVLLAALRRAGLAVPDDVAVIGVDDIPLAALTDPPLTTVVNDTSWIAQRVVAGLMADLEGTEPPADEDADLVDVVVRASA
ncbi:DNA-binding LacI/PurR family transcriptional regulator [Friedmanniella endophytica]|uniref:DNA-binding LacI/PurR family transcriptional regulator n=1 Tax=Microlunatus kandeliicorticis TaxID=1759536 RepID=A0A7W3IVH5_9ACTN|nr:LacI family DNA-binding transcriptional regulator [Microlunatus kandeliicorticis]MBA8796011.1 DNA-binding LacI/PurR family transcriptional regulator [Microlunatus kandeliicorticis]